MKLDDNIIMIFIVPCACRISQSNEDVNQRAGSDSDDDSDDYVSFTASPKPEDRWINEHVIPDQDDSPASNDGEGSFEADDNDLLYGSTPPRQMRMSRKQTNKGNSGKGGKPPRLVLQVTPKKESKKDKGQNQAKKSLAKKLDSTDFAPSPLHTKQKFHQRKMRTIHLDRTSEREFKQKAITYDGSELHPPPTPTYKFRPFDSLPSPNLKIGSSTCFRSVKSQQVSPPTSPGQKPKKTSVSSSKLHYEPERVEFHRTFSALIRMGSTKKDNSQDVPQKIRRQDGMAQDIFQMQWNEILWLELTAYHNELSIDEQDLYLMDARKRVKDIINDIVKFKFQSLLSNKGLKSTCSLDRKRSSFKKVQRTLARLSNGSGQSGSSSSSQGDSVDTAQVNSNACETCFNPSAGLRRQPSLSDNGICMPLSTALNSYITDTCDAWYKINVLLGKLEQVQLLYPNSKALQNDCPEFSDEQFTRQLETLCLWMNLTNDISHKFLMTSQILGVIDIDGLWWPCLDLPGYCIEHPEEYFEAELEEEDQPMVKPTARRPMLGALGHWNCVQSNSQEQEHVQHASCDTQSTMLSHDTSRDRLDSRDMSHDHSSSHLPTETESQENPGTNNPAPFLPKDSVDRSHRRPDDDDYCSEVSFGSQSLSLSSTHSSKPNMSRNRSVTFDTSLSFPEENRLSPEPSSEPQMSSTPHERSPFAAEESPRTNRIFSECHFSFDYDSSTSIYRPFVDRSLKHQGLRKMTKRLDKMLGQTMKKMRLALEKSTDVPDSRRISSGVSVFR